MKVWGDKLYKAAIINNHECFKLINNKFRSLGIEIDIIQYNHIFEIRDKFDFLFIDFDYTSLNSVEFIHKYVSIYNDVLIVIISNNYEYLSNNFDLYPFDFIDKNNFYLGMNNCLRRLVQKINCEKKFITINNKGCIFNINSENIIFCCSQGHACFIHTIDDVLKTTKYKLSILEKNLDSINFYLINRSYLINWKHVLKIEDKNIILTNNNIVKISNSRYKDALLSYQKYLKRNIL